MHLIGTLYNIMNRGYSLSVLSADFSANSSRLGYEEHIPGQTRDWNEELQTTRELPRKHLPERLIRERAIFKVISIRPHWCAVLCIVL